MLEPKHFQNYHCSNFIYTNMIYVFPSMFHLPSSRNLMKYHSIYQKLRTWIYFLPPMASGDDHRFFSAPVLKIADLGGGADRVCRVFQNHSLAAGMQDPVPSPSWWWLGLS